MRPMEMDDRETCNKHACDDSACIVLKVYTSEGPRYVALCRDHATAIGPKMLGAMLRDPDKAVVSRLGALTTGVVDEGTATLTPAEAVFGLLAWLTTRKQPSTFSAKHDSSPAAAIAAVFCKTNNLGTCRDEWADYLTHPPVDLTT